MKTAPEAGGSWPVISHLHLLGGPKPPHIVLADMANKQGPIFTIKMGVHRALVVSDHQNAKECFTTNHKAFATRPKTLGMEYLSYNHAMFGFIPYGPYWRQMRNLATLELLSTFRLDKLRHVRGSEIKISMQELHQFWDENKHSYDDNKSERWKQKLKDFLDLSGMFVISDALPYLRWLDIGGHERFMKKVRKELDEVAEGWLEDHKRKRSDSAGELKSHYEGFVDVMLSILTDTEKHDVDTINKATCLTLILAASDTTMVTLTWALSLLLNNRSALRKAQEELDIHVGKDKLVEEYDIKKLVYLQSIVKETMRLGTRLLSNLYKLHRDPRVWSHPCEFQPERFLTTYKDFDVRGQNFELIPFGSGRRMCPGVSLALQVLELTLASLLQGFELRTPLDEPIDMSEAIGMTNLKATPLQVFVTPRLTALCH
ncbi:hypothetical protein PTKIN_Ptkin16aG0016800 [Pterospermum kingtungense]